MNKSIKRFILNARKNSTGYWIIPSKDNIDYPESGNTECFGIEDNSYWFTHRNKCIQRLLLTYNPKNPILDIGAGNGFVALLAEKIGYQVIALEPGLDGVVNSRKRGLKNIVRGSLESARIRKGSMGGAFLFDVLEHVNKDIEFLIKIYTALQKDGMVFLSVPAWPILWSSEDDVAGHYRRYTLLSLGNKLQKAGFQIVFASYYFSVLFLPILLLRVFPEKIFGFRNKNFHLKTGDYVIKNRLINNILIRLISWETRFMGKKSIGIGSSIIMAARKLEKNSVTQQ